LRRPYGCAEGADALVIATEWEQFRALDFDHLKSVMVSPVLVDLRNVYRTDDILAKGFTYASVDARNRLQRSRRRKEPLRSD